MMGPNIKQMVKDSDMRRAGYNTYVLYPQLTENKCFCCEQEITVFNFHLAHIIASANGGNFTLENLGPTCSSRNLVSQKRNLLQRSYLVL